MALDGGALQMHPRNGWRAFEVITVGENPPDDGHDWAMPGTFDGLGAWLPDSETLRVLVNHEISDATVSEVNLGLAAYKQAIANVIAGGDTGGVGFVTSARQAYDRWSDDGGASWNATSGPSNTAFSRFCSGQSYAANTFGLDRGFVDDLYIHGEETFSDGRLFALDLAKRDFYQLSDHTGSAPGGLGGMPRDSWENAALIDTGETEHVALLLSADGGSQRMQLYIGHKGLDKNGAPSDSLLARNGLEYGGYYYLNDSLPTSGDSHDGFFDTTTTGALASSKLEDIDTSPSNPTQVLLGDQNSGLFTFDMRLVFGSNGFDADASGFSITKVLDHAFNTNDQFGDADNVDWTDATALGGESYPEGILLVNEDSSNLSGEVWMSRPNGDDPVKIADTIGLTGATESTGIIDISELVGYLPGSVLLTNNQGRDSSMTTLIHPHATPIPEPGASALLLVAAGMASSWRLVVPSAG